MPSCPRSAAAGVRSEAPISELAFYGLKANWDGWALLRTSRNEAHPAICNPVLLPKEIVDSLVRLRIRYGTVLSRPAASLNRNDWVGRKPTDPFRVRVAVVKPGIASPVYDPKPRLVHRPSRSPFVKDDDLSADFDQGQVRGGVSHAESQHNRCGDHDALHVYVPAVLHLLRRILTLKGFSVIRRRGHHASGAVAPRPDGGKAPLD